MGGDSSDALHKALRGALANAPAVAELIGGTGSNARIFDWPSPGSIYPLVSIGDMVALPYNADDLKGSEIDVTIHTWARGETARSVARQIGEAISELLDENEASLPVTGHKVMSITRQMGQVLRDEASDAQLAGSTAHGVYRFRVFTIAEA